MTLGILRKNSPILTLMWLQLPPEARWFLLAESNGDIGNLRGARVAKFASILKKEKQVS